MESYSLKIKKRQYYTVMIGIKLKYRGVFYDPLPTLPANTD